MDALTRWIARHAIAGWDQVGRPEVRARYGVLEGWVSIVGNLVLAAVKVALGLALHSAGLVADAVHSLSDMASSVVVIISAKVSSKPPDPEHPFGHAKAEYVATLVVSLLMIMAGFQIGQESLIGLVRGAPPEAAGLPLTWPLLGVLVFLMLAKEAMGTFSRTLGRMIRSDVLAADAWHHRTDALSTGIVIIGLAGRNVGLAWLDGAAGLLVALWIVYTGGKLAYDAISPLLGEMAPAGEIESLRAIAQGVPGVVSTHDIKVHKYGHFYFTTLHCELSDRLDVHRMHEISVIIETRILKRFPGECVVHMDPVNLFHPLLHPVTDTIKEAVLGHPELVDFRDLNLWTEGGIERGQVEVSVVPEADEARYPRIAALVADRVRQRFPALELAVELKVDFTAEPLRPEPPGAETPGAETPAAGAPDAGAQGAGAKKPPA
jgi:cation diffusion facilitator family transporter